MSDRVLTDKVRAEALGMGMDLVGFGPVERWKHAPYLLSPQAILPESKTVVVSAIHITDTWTEMGGEPEPQDNSPGGWMDQNSLLDRVAYALTRLLNRHGHKAIAVASSNIWRYRKYEGIPSLFAPDLAHIHAATAAGLAEIGWSGLAITPEFGARCRFISVVTSADLVPTPMYDGPKLCDMCMQCVKICPTASLRKELGTPHEVNIGGKVFRYANKNIWRCAWAEHFNLDLNSQHLKEWDTIGEKEILREIAEKGRRGHERGVCQKVCVPPHLRTREGSFGRPDKLIAQNRINRRYPESMPTLRKMRDDITAAAVRMGVDCCAVGPITKDLETVPGYTLRKEMPGARTAIAFAMRLPPGTGKSPALGRAAWTTMHHICLRIARIIEDYGYHAASYTGAQDLCEMVGLGRRGTSPDRAIVTPEFGDSVLTAAVTTDALLDPTPAPASTDRPLSPARLTPAQLRRRLEMLAETSLVSLFGVAPADRFANTVADLTANTDMKQLGEYVVDKNPDYHGPYVPEIQRLEARIRGPQDHVPGAKSVIVLGMHFPAEIVANAGLPKSQQIGTYAFWQYQTRNELCFAAFAIARALTAAGYGVSVTEDMLGIGSGVDSHRGMLPDARCNAVEAVAAGLGRLGANGSLLTPEYGPHQRQIVIVTDAELPADGVHLGADPCKDCGQCRSQCPMQALENNTFDVRLGDTVIGVPRIDRHRCDWSKRYALCKEEGPALIGNKTDVPKPVGRVTIEDIAKACSGRDPVMKWRPAILETCLRGCPAGTHYVAATGAHP